MLSAEPYVNRRSGECGENVDTGKPLVREQLCPDDGGDCHESQPKPN